MIDRDRPAGKGDRPIGEGEQPICDSHPPAGDGEPAASISLRKADNSQSLVESEIDTSPAAPSRGRRVVAAAAGARDRTIEQLVALLVPLIRATRIPTLVVVGIAAVPALTVMVVALLRPGPDDGFWLFLGLTGLVLAGWLGLRRHQLLAVARDPAALRAALASVVSGRDMWDQLVTNVSTKRVGTAVVRNRSRPLRILRGMWRGVQLTGVVTEVLDRPELSPLMPGRLRGMWFLGISCLVAGLVLGLAVLVAGALYLLGA